MNKHDYELRQDTVDAGPRPTRITCLCGAEIKRQRIDTPTDWWHRCIEFIAAHKGPIIKAQA